MEGRLPQESALPIAYYGKGSESLDRIISRIPPQSRLKRFDHGWTNLSVLISLQLALIGASHAIAALSHRISSRSTSPDLKKHAILYSIRKIEAQAERNLFGQFWTWEAGAS